MRTLFISDLHLSEERPTITELFLRFCAEEAPGAEALYILGDLFEIWLGDDYVLPHYDGPCRALARLAAGGTPVYFIAGNRDFLLGPDGAARCGMTLLAEPTVMDLYGTPTVLLHGDTLCTDDVPYQEFRRMVRDPAWQRDFLARPPQERLAMARRVREISRTETAAKPEEIMDVNAGAVAMAFRAAGVRQMIHGHTHRPALHALEVDSTPARRLVLGDWYHRGSFLECDAAGCRLRDYG